MSLSGSPYYAYVTHNSVEGNLTEEKRSCPSLHRESQLHAWAEGEIDARAGIVEAATILSTSVSLRAIKLYLDAPAVIGTEHDDKPT